LIAAYTSNENTTTKITPVTASTNSDRWKMESAGVELGEEMLGTAGSLLVAATARFGQSYRESYDRPANSGPTMLLHDLFSTSQFHYQQF
jgi:hypothetical protein